MGDVGEGLRLRASWVLGTHPEGRSPVGALRETRETWGPRGAGEPQLTSARRLSMRSADRRSVSIFSMTSPRVQPPNTAFPYWYPTSCREGGDGPSTLQFLRCFPPGPLRGVPRCLPRPGPSKACCFGALAFEASPILESAICSTPGPCPPSCAPARHYQSIISRSFPKSPCSGACATMT